MFENSFANSWPGMNAVYIEVVITDTAATHTRLSIEEATAFYQQLGRAIKTASGDPKFELPKD